MSDLNFGYISYAGRMLNFLSREEWTTGGTVKVTFAVVLTALTAHLLTRKRHRMPPGPRGWPFIGNLLDLRNVPLFEKVTEWARIYGPIISFRVGSNTLVALNNKDVAMEALVLPELAGRPLSLSAHLLSHGGKSIALTDVSPTWKLHRKLASKALRLYMTGTKLEESVENSMAYAFQLIKQEKNAIDPSRYMSVIIINIINNICFSRTFEVKEDNFKELVDSMDTFLVDFGNGILDDFFPLLRLCPTKKLRRMQELNHESLAPMNAEILKHRHTLDRDNMRDYCDMLLLAQEDARGEEDPALMAQITDQHIVQAIADIFAGGVDTSRFLLLWALFYLAKHQDIQEKMQKEIDEVLGDRQYPRLSDRPHLPYTEAVFCECLRMGSVTPITIPHAALEDVKISGYDIPKGTTVLFNTYALHFDPDEWSEPNVFNPERFLDADGQIVKRDGFLPFSIGRRVCLGESVAKAELHMLLTGLMRHFKVTFASKVDVDHPRAPLTFLCPPKAFEVYMDSRL